MNDQNESQLMEQFGHYLTLLLASSTLTDEQKEAWSVLVNYMELEQLFSFAQFLEQNVKDAAEADLQPLAEELRSIMEKYQKQEDALQDAALAELEELKKEIM